MRATNAGVAVPTVFGWKNNVIVMELVGDAKPASPLKDRYPEDPQKFFKMVLKEMKTLYKGGIIHGDLSSFNILNLNEKPVLIDFSQATLLKTPNSDELLVRDIRNVLTFFKKLGVEKDFDKIYKTITKTSNSK